jgi:Flp pilus assembly protein TadD
MAPKVAESSTLYILLPGLRGTCLFRTAPPMQALAIYQELLRQEDPDPLYHTYSAACYYYMGQTQQAEAAVQQVREWGVPAVVEAVLLPCCMWPS